jgi:shikimate kinase
MNKNVYFIGFMGTGKTTVAEIVANQLQRDFIETDSLIEVKAGTTISNIFARQGEEHFRRLETEVLYEVAHKDNLIVSCGGGIVLNKDNLELMHNSGVTICLRATPATIYLRVKNQTHRPLLEVADPQAKIKELLDKRDYFYQQADFFIDTNDLTPSEVAKKALRIIKK